jgi:hypothetical protein
MIALISSVSLLSSAHAQVGNTPHDAGPAAVDTSEESAATIDGPELEAKVLDILTRMTEFISHASSYALVADTEHEFLERDGRRIEFGSHIVASVKRPSQAHVRFDNRDGDNATIILDGETVSVFSTRGSAYIYDTTPQPGDIDASFEFLAEQLQTPDQLHHFFALDLTAAMKSLLKSGNYIGEAKIAGVLCDNLALRNNDEDVQLWIEKGSMPVPRRIVVTYKNIEGQPQFRAQFSEWEFSPDLSNTVFSFSPPAHAQRIEFFGDTAAD